MPDGRSVEAVVFDLDGVIVDSESVWDDVRRKVVSETGGRWRPEATREMMGMSAPEWSHYLHHHLDVPLPEPDIDRLVVDRLLASYERHLPLLPGTLEAVHALARVYPLALATSANRRVLEAVLADGHIEDRFTVTVSAEEVPRGKPAPDVHLEAARRLAVHPVHAAAIEDSTNGISSAAAAGMAVIAVPNTTYPPSPESLPLARLVLPDLTHLTPALIASLPASP